MTHQQIERAEPPSSRVGFRTAPPPARLLLAEDDGEMRTMVASSLRSDGYEVVEVADGGELLVHLASAYVAGREYDAFDLVVSDLRMPICSGLHILEGLRRARWSTPMILMTAFGDRPTRERVESQGAVLFDKPFDLDDLRTAVLHLLHKSVLAKHAVPVASIGEEDPIVELVATRESGIDAWSIKWLLQSEDMQVYLGGRAIVSTAFTTDVYVLRGDAERAREVIARYDGSLSPIHRSRRR